MGVNSSASHQKSIIYKDPFFQLITMGVGWGFKNTNRLNYEESSINIDWMYNCTLLLFAI